MIDLLTKNIHKYCKEHTASDNRLLSELEQYTWDNEDVPQMISGQMVGKFLQSIIRMIAAQKIVEVGTFTGYSALQMAEAIPLHGEIHTCELMKKHAETAQSFFDKSDYGKKIHSYAKKNPKSSIIVQDDKSGHMVYLKKYSQLEK